MKNLVYVLAAAVLLTACKPEAPKDYVTLSGKIANQNSDSLVVLQRGFSKTIKVNTDGTFSDTLKVKEGVFVINDGTEQARVYLKNGYDLSLYIDTKEFDETLAFSGNGANPNNYLNEKSLLMEKIYDLDALFELDETTFSEKIKTNGAAVKSLLDNAGELDSLFIANQEKEAGMVEVQLRNMYKKRQELSALNGQESVQFTDYENIKGGTTSLSDLKGKYVYIDLWATWCGPCIAEIPSLKAIEKEYHGKNIEFVSISIDKKSAYEKWKTMIAEKELGGMQLYANEDKTFTSAYKVTGIPRFILIDPQGVVVKADAPRPSSPGLKTLLETLDI
ncbi:TlpA family protein disulfide reductase [Algibacter miyuki]|uniref:TlpA family protein disulfide reductase n=1 Tax=Algibacter miyuki TaxID=1306933 RepID=A0ABV5H4T6_9FLAO|nr:TlpA disulfide reductase family protein [Algibacter miyuki]MDN3665847.1 TlpA disulfide reductase family protein [Algibacter miyuki]